MWEIISYVSYFVLDIVQISALPVYLHSIIQCLLLPNILSC